MDLESGRNSGKTLLCFALLCFCAHEQHCTHQMKPPQTKMLLRSQAVQHWHDRRWHAVAWLMDQAVQHWQMDQSSLLGRPEHADEPVLIDLVKELIVGFETLGKLERAAIRDQLEPC